jgi:hypothetical protein
MGKVMQAGSTSCRGNNTLCQDPAMRKYRKCAGTYFPAAPLACSIEYSLETGLEAIQSPITTSVSDPAMLKMLTKFSY